MLTSALLRTLLAPDAPASAAPEAGAPSSSEPAGAPAAPDPSVYVAQGIETGQKRLISELGVRDLEELRGLVAAARKTADPAAGKVPVGDKIPASLADNPDYLKVAAELGETRRERDELRAEREKLARMADEARREKVRATAMSHGVGPAQADAFLALFSDRFQLGADGSLVTLGRLADGTSAPLGQAPKDVILGLLKDHPYLAAAPAAGGVGSGTTKLPPEKPAGLSIWDAPEESALQRRLKREKR